MESRHRALPRVMWQPTAVSVLSLGEPSGPQAKTGRERLVNEERTYGPESDYKSQHGLREGQYSSVQSPSCPSCVFFPLSMSLTFMPDSTPF